MRRRRLPGFPAALEERQFRLLFVGQSFSALGDGLMPVAVAFAVLDLTGSASDLGFVLAAGLLPVIALSLLGGVLGDRLPRQRLMLASDLVRTLAQASTATLLLTGHAQLWQLIVLQAVNGGAEAFFGPAAAALVPQTVRPANLQQANALLSISGSAGLVVGPAVAGVIGAIAGPGGAFAADAATFGLSALSLTLLRPRHVPAAAAEPASALGLLSDLAAGFREVRARLWLWLELLRSALTLLIVSAPVLVLGPLIAKRSLGGVTAWAMIMTAFSLGTIVGAAAALRLRPQRPLLVATALTLLVAPTSALLALAAPAPAIAAATVLNGGVAGFFATVWRTTLQEQIPPRLLSRVSAWDSTASFALLPAGCMLAGIASDLIGVRALLWIGVGWLLASAPTLAAVPAVRNIRTLAPSPG